ncbi:hypothetical protein niasHT_009001 [Heterodera trifolii]|uniref:Uncharacterized protein n=1 Tax=Heterodera trifolii TaxID=157864 RepID=A0ABD2LXE3_9BILA
MLFRETVNAKPIVDIHKKWEETAGMCMCVIVVCQENKASIFLVTGCRVGSCSSAYSDLLPVCNKAGQKLSCHECRGESCNPHFLKLKDAPPTPRPEWLESVVEACKKRSKIDCKPCGWAKCVSYPGYIGSGCCPDEYKLECCF